MYLLCFDYPIIFKWFCYTWIDQGLKKESDVWPFISYGRQISTNILSNVYEDRKWGQKTWKEREREREKERERERCLLLVMIGIDLLVQMSLESFTFIVLIVGFFATPIPPLYQYQYAPVDHNPSFTTTKSRFTLSLSLSYIYIYIYTCINTYIQVEDTFCGFSLFNNSRHKHNKQTYSPHP